MPQANLKSARCGFRIDTQKINIQLWLNRSSGFTKSNNNTKQRKLKASKKTKFRAVDSECKSYVLLPLKVHYVEEGELQCVVCERTTPQKIGGKVGRPNSCANFPN